MTPELAAACILLGDWGTAASHMAYRTRVTMWEDRDPVSSGITYEPERMPFYARRAPLFQDVWHVIAGLRYIPFGALAWVCFPSWEWYAGTAFVNWLGWCALKKIHGKPWPLIPAWIRNLR